MASFAGSPTDLKERTYYELEALESIRSDLFLQNERPDSRLSVTLGDEKIDGLYPSTRKRVSDFSPSAEDVRSSLARFRPLIFSAAFKVQDMIAEWVLHANGSDKWNFKDKVNAYNKFREDGTFNQPNTFLSWPELSLAFWELYKKLTDFRGTVIHGRLFSVSSDGTLTINYIHKKTGKQKTLKLSDKKQSAYVRAMCLLTKNLTEGGDLAGLYRALVADTFATLEPIHKESAFTPRPVSFQSMQVTVPSYLIHPSNQVAVNIDFADLNTDGSSFSYFVIWRIAV